MIALYITIYLVVALAIFFGSVFTKDSAEKGESKMIRYPNLVGNLKYVGSNQAVVRKIALTSNRDHRDFVKALCQHFIAHPNPMMVPIYSFRDLSFGSGGSYFRYCYDMKAMGMLSGDEKRIVDFMGDNPSPNHASIPGFRKMFPELMSFLELVINQNRYHDLHSGNVMLDEEENYRLVDVEGFLNSKKLDDPINKWITEGD